MREQQIIWREATYSDGESELLLSCLIGSEFAGYLGRDCDGPPASFGFRCLELQTSACLFKRTIHLNAAVLDIPPAEGEKLATAHARSQRKVADHVQLPITVTQAIKHAADLIITDDFYLGIWHAGWGYDDGVCRDDAPSDGMAERAPQ